VPQSRLNTLLHKHFQFPLVVALGVSSSRKRKARFIPERLLKQVGKEDRDTGHFTLPDAQFFASKELSVAFLNRHVLNPATPIIPRDIRTTVEGSGVVFWSEALIAGGPPSPVL
jgi:hypothetical protein